MLTGEAVSVIIFASNCGELLIPFLIGEMYKFTGPQCFPWMLLVLGILSIVIYYVWLALFIVKKTDCETDCEKVTPTEPTFNTTNENLAIISTLQADLKNK